MELSSIGEELLNFQITSLPSTDKMLIYKMLLSMQLE
jgi:hypothetical protein